MKYTRGFYPSVITEINHVVFSQLKRVSEQCDEFIVGIPDQWTYARLFDTDEGYCAAEMAELLEEFEFINKVVILEQSDLLMQNVHQKFNFDLYYYGTEYGCLFLADLEYAKNNNICMMPLIPDVIPAETHFDALHIVLNNLRNTQKVILFGTGRYFDEYMKRYGSQKKPAYAVDNDSAKWGTVKQGIRILSPDEIVKENPDDVLVVMCAKNYAPLKEQLLGIGKYNYRSMMFLNSMAMLNELGISLAKEQDYLTRGHKALVKMLKMFDDICSKHGIHYYLICGTLIGALRHKGFIPWDDDVDIAITRSDYNKLKEVFALELGDNAPYMLLDFFELGKGVFLDCMPRVIYTGEYFPTKVYKKVSSQKCKEGPDRLFLDIYIMDSAFDNGKKHNFQMGALKVIYNMAMGHRKNINYTDYERIGKKTIRLMKFVHCIGRLIPLSILLGLYDKISQKANKDKGSAGKGTDNYYMNSCAITCIERKFKKQWFGNGIRVPFEDIEVMIPDDSPALLEGMGYHNYMNYPSYGMRRPSHYYNSDIEIW